MQAIHLGGRLFQQYIVDMAAKVEQNQLNYQAHNQQKIRAELYQGLCDLVETDVTSIGADAGRRIVLPASYPGSPRFMRQRYQDAMAIVRSEGLPDIFVTFTCNPKGKKITDDLLPAQTATDRPDIVSRVFNFKVKALLNGLTKDGVFGKTIAHIWTREYQKRGLPHIHLLLILDNNRKIETTDDIDRLVCASLPNPENEELWTTVTKCLLHGPCGSAYPNAPCMKDGKCSKRYPRAFCAETYHGEDGYPVYRRTDNGRTFQRSSNGFVYDNRWVVLYIPYIAKKFDAHINVEVSAGTHCVKYLFEYVYKGRDRTAVEVDGPVNEIKRFEDARYLSPAEACDSLQGVKMHQEHPPVVQLVVHLPGQHNVLFRDGEDLAAVAQRAATQRTTLTAWFDYNASQETSRDVLYLDFPRDHVWKVQQKV